MTPCLKLVELAPLRAPHLWAELLTELLTRHRIPYATSAATLQYKTRYMSANKAGSTALWAGRAYMRVKCCRERTGRRTRPHVR